MRFASEVIPSPTLSNPKFPSTPEYPRLFSMPSPNSPWTCHVVNFKGSKIPARELSQDVGSLVVLHALGGMAAV